MALAIRRLDALDDSVPPLFAALHNAQITAAPSLGHLPARDAADAWSRRRAAYTRWLSVPGAFALLATEEDRPVGFALVTFASGYHGWSSGERVAELKDLSVAADVRGRGIGSRLMDAVESQLARQGVTDLRLNVIAANADAVRFYERRGLVAVTTVLLGRVSPAAGDVGGAGAARSHLRPDT
jgi:GNAT superfamily N-acetyltransferase